MPNKKDQDTVDGLTDMGTSEIAKRHTVVPRLTRGQWGYNARVVDETEIDRMLLKDLITPSDHHMLETFLSALKKANFVGIRSPRYDSVLSADPALVGDRRANQIRSVTEVMKALDRCVGKDVRMSAVNLVLLDVPWPHGMDVMKEVIVTLTRVLRHA